MSLLDKFYGVLIGCAVGDAIGELASGHQDKHSLNEWLSKGDILRYTDDTAMSIGLVESILEKQSVDENSIGKKFQTNYSKDPWRSYSASTPNIFARVKRQGIPYSKAAEQLYDGEGSLGNGASMRIAPLGILYNSSPQLLKFAELSARVTHSHPIAIDGALSMSYAISVLSSLNNVDSFPLDKFCTGIIKVCKTKEMKNNYLIVFEALASKAKPNDVAKIINLSQKAHESVPFAVYSFLKNKNSFQDSLFCAILNGGDQDTLGAMTSSLSGAFLGKEAIPDKWINQIENLEYISSLSNKLFKLHGRMNL